MLCCFKVIELLKAGTSQSLSAESAGGGKAVLSSQVCHAVVQESPSRFSSLSRSRPAERAAAAKTTALESQLEFYKSALGDQIARVHVPFCQVLCQASQHRPAISLSSVFSRSALRGFVHLGGFFRKGDIADSLLLQLSSYRRVSHLH